MYAGSKAFFYALSRSRLLKRLASKYGMAREDSFAHRFIAGDSIEDAIAAARTLQSHGMLITLDYLGESSRTLEEASAATREYARLLDVIVASGIERNVSLKVTQLGIDVDRATAVDNLRRILEPAQRHGFFVRIDMEDSPYTDVTLEVFETLWQQGYRNVGVALQSYLYRTEKDVEPHERARRARPARQGRVQGATRSRVPEEGGRRCQLRPADAPLLDQGVYPAIATHDPAMIDATKAYAKDRRYRERSIRVPDALWHQARSAGVAVSPRATECGSTSRSATNGFPTS